MTRKLGSSETTPLTPPLSEEDRLSRLRLYRSRRVGVATFHRLIDEEGSAEAALSALPGLADAAGIEGYEPFSEAAALAELRAGRRAGARLVFRGEAAYPAALRDVEDAPPLFWALGDPALLARPAVALVGARNASGLGERMARKLAGELGRAGLVVVSGLARGIDAAAHDAALASGTVAVLGGGVDVAYPTENVDLQARIGKSGLLVSEQPMRLRPQARHFPPRNRIISGLARALVVVEAAARSGSLITARNALDQGREVMAVPGHPFDARASGCNLLIRDGALLVRSAEDVLEALGGTAALALTAQAAGPDAPADAAPEPPPAAIAPPREAAAAGDLPRRILARLGPTPLGEDQLLRDLALPAQALAPALVDLELDGLVERHPGGLISRTA